MAEIIIKRNTTYTNPDPDKDKMVYKMGDIIDVVEDNATKDMPWLTVLKIPELAVADIKYLTNSIIADVGAARKEIVRRRYKIPETVMSNLFGLNKTVDTITKIAWTAIKVEIIDKALL